VSQPAVSPISKSAVRRKNAAFAGLATRDTAHLEICHPSPASHSSHPPPKPFTLVDKNRQLTGADRCAGNLRPMSPHLLLPKGEGARRADEGEGHWANHGPAPSAARLALIFLAVSFRVWDRSPALWLKKSADQPIDLAADPSPPLHPRTNQRESSCVIPAKEKAPAHLLFGRNTAMLSIRLQPRIDGAFFT